MTGGNGQRTTKWRTLPARAIDSVRASRIRSVAGISVPAAALMFLTAALLCFFTPFLSVVSMNAKDIVTETHIGWSWMTSAGLWGEMFYEEWSAKNPVCNLWLILVLLCIVGAAVLLLSRLPRRYAAGCCGGAMLSLLCFRMFFRLNYGLGKPKLPDLVLSCDAHAGMFLCLIFLIAACGLCLADGEKI